MEGAVQNHTRNAHTVLINEAPVGGPRSLSCRCAGGQVSWRPGRLAVKLPASTSSSTTPYASRRDSSVPCSPYVKSMVNDGPNRCGQPNGARVWVVMGPLTPAWSSGETS